MYEFQQMMFWHTTVNFNILTLTMFSKAEQVTTTAVVIKLATVWSLIIVSLAVHHRKVSLILIVSFLFQMEVCHNIVVRYSPTSALADF